MRKGSPKHESERVDGILSVLSAFFERLICHFFSFPPQNRMGAIFEDYTRDSSWSLTFYLAIIIEASLVAVLVGIQQGAGVKQVCALGRLLMSRIVMRHLCCYSLLGIRSAPWAKHFIQHNQFNRVLLELSS